MYHNHSRILRVYGFGDLPGRDREEGKHHPEEGCGLHGSLFEECECRDCRGDACRKRKLQRYCEAELQDPAEGYEDHKGFVKEKGNHRYLGNA